MSDQPGEEPSIHEAACRLMDRDPSLSYSDAITRVLERQRRARTERPTGA
jgi:hypothetical protein